MTKTERVKAEGRVAEQTRSPPPPSPQLLPKAGVGILQMETRGNSLEGTACAKTRGGKDLQCLGDSEASRVAEQRVAEQKVPERVVERK